MLNNDLLSRAIAIVMVKAATADGTTAVTSDAVDLQAYKAEGVLFLTSFATPAADNTLKTQKSDDDSTYTTVTGSETAPGASDETAFNDIGQFPARYAKAVVTRGTSTVLGPIYALLYRLRAQPVGTNATAGTTSGTRLVQPS